MAVLRLVTGVEPDKRFELTADRSTIGRSTDCEVALDVAAVSRRHAEIVREGAAFTLKDLGSRNGTYVNGARVVAPKRLASGDRIVICDQEFAFEAPSLSGAAPDPRPLLAGGPKSSGAS